MLPLLILLIICIEWFFIKWIARTNKYIVVYTTIVISLVYLILRLLEFDSRIILVDIIAWICFTTMLGYLVKKRIKNKILKIVMLIVLIVVSNFSLLLNGVITHQNWMMDSAIKYRLKTNIGNIVILRGSDAGGVSYTKYSLREELFWGVFFKEYDKKIFYDGSKLECIIELEKENIHQIKFNICKVKIEK